MLGWFFAHSRIIAEGAETTSLCISHVQRTRTPTHRSISHPKARAASNSLIVHQTPWEQILQLGFIKKHIHNFLADIVSRESHKIGEGTMVLKAAAVNMLADAEVWREGIAVTSNMRVHTI